MRVTHHYNTGVLLRFMIQGYDPKVYCMCITQFYDTDVQYRFMILFYDAGV